VLLLLLLMELAFGASVLFRVHASVMMTLLLLLGNTLLLACMMFKIAAATAAPPGIVPVLFA
jgi:hypothetical protein